VSIVFFADGDQEDGAGLGDVLADLDDV